MEQDSTLPMSYVQIIPHIVKLFPFWNSKEDLREPERYKQIFFAHIIPLAPLNILEK